VHDRYPDKDVYFSECSGGEWSPRFDENLKWFVNTLIIGSTRNWARGVLLWNLALDQSYGPHLGGCGNCRGVLTVDTAKAIYTRSVEYYALAHASKFVMPGAHRIGSSGGDSTLTHVAFRNPDGGSVALIVLNSDAHARSFVVRVDGGSFLYELPAAAVATFVIPRR
jgi:glucosylceramidase